MIRAQIILDKKQHEALAQIALEEGSSISAIVREMIDLGLRYRQRKQILKAVQELEADYRTNPDLTSLTELDGEDFYNAEG
jgi:hypothetical protein